MNDDKTTPAMEKFDHGPLQSYQLIWKSGHVETVQAHQVILPNDGFFGSRPSPWITIHGEIDGRWMLILRVHGDEIVSIRLLTGEVVL